MKDTLTNSQPVRYLMQLFSDVVASAMPTPVRKVLAMKSPSTCEPLYQRYRHDKDGKVHGHIRNSEA